LVRDKPGRPRQERPRRWPGCRGTRPGAGASADGRRAGAALRLRVVHASPGAQHAALPYTAAHATEAERIAEHIQRVAAGGFACAAAAEAAITASAGRGQGRRGRKPRLGCYPPRPARGDAVPSPPQRSRRGRPPQAEASPVKVRYRLRVHPAALIPAEDAQGWTVLAPTLQPAAWPEAAWLQT